jgi:hypothetical protein
MDQPTPGFATPGNRVLFATSNRPVEFTMKFIEMTGATLSEILNDGELHERDFESAGITDLSIVRINQQGDIEIRRSLKWDVVGGLLGSFDERVRQTTGLDWA